jgi:putative solute:sodium symporter small subunit
VTKGRPGPDRARSAAGSGPGAWHEEVDYATRARRSAYWRRNIQSVGVLLAIWFLVSYGLGILWVEPLNELTLPGTHYPLGFWFAQQGAIYVFVILIFVYVGLMNRLDREFDVDETGPGAATVDGATGSRGGKALDRGARGDGGEARDRGARGDGGEAPDRGARGGGGGGPA